MKADEKILQTFRKSEPILIEEIVDLFHGKPRHWVDYVLKTMVEENRLHRYSTGVYYIPGIPHTLFYSPSVEDVVKKKYIEDRKGAYGYLAGDSLLFSLGLIKDPPKVMTVATNREKSRGRSITIHGKTIYITKTHGRVNRENQAVLMFLEAVRLLEIDWRNEERLKILCKYIMDKEIDLLNVSEYCRYFPDSVSKKILSSQLVHMMRR